MKSSFLHTLLHLLYPTKCPVCGEIIDPGERFCSDCATRLTPYSGGFRIESAASFTAAFEYDDKISPAVILMKKGICGNADYALGKCLAYALKNGGIAQNTDIIVPVPMYKTDMRKRGFNQTELIAKVLSNELGIEVCSRAVVKTRITAEQKQLNRTDRKINLSGAFSVSDATLITGKRVLLVDDVCTTGATLTELTALLLKNGALQVHCASCCKTPGNED